MNRKHTLKKNNQNTLANMEIMKEVLSEQEAANNEIEKANTLLERDNQAFKVDIKELHTDLTRLKAQLTMAHN